MNSESLKIKEINKKFLELFNIPQDCEVSIASKEIMLDRFCNEKEINFPFT